MQDKTVDPLSPGPVNDPLKKEQGYALTAPLRLGEHIYDDGMPSLRDSASFICARERVGEDLAQLNACPARDDVRTLHRDRQPSDVLAPVQKIADPVPFFRTQNFERLLRD